MKREKHNRIVSRATEQRNPRSMRIDELPTDAILTLINDEDATVSEQVRHAIPILTQIAEAIVERFEKGGTLHYFGAGTSGRMAVLDAAEVPPTYGFPPERIQAHLAGGLAAMQAAIENAEDISQEAVDIVNGLGKEDIVFGIAASGTTPYVVEALRAAHQRELLTIGFTANPDTPVATIPIYPIVIPTGPEVITGSTRMKAATAQKFVLQALSTTVMIRLGRVRSNLMLGMHPTNIKLRQRAVALITQLLEDKAVDFNEEKIRQVLEDHDFDIKRALKYLLESATHCSKSTGDNIRTKHIPTILGIDIGGSGIRATLLESSRDNQPTPLENGHFQFSTNGSAQDLLPDEALLAITQFIHNLIGKERRPDWVSVGLAGAEYRPERTKKIQERLQQSFPESRLLITNDGIAAYIGALGIKPGILLAVGTGSIAIGTDGVNGFTRKDGLGFMTGDFGSGAWLGQKGCQLAISGLTGRVTTTTTLMEAFQTQFDSVKAFMARLSNLENPAALFASFAKVIIELAASGDATAQMLCMQAVEELNTTVMQAYRALENSKDMCPTVVLKGGLMHKQSWLRTQLELKLGQQGFRIEEEQASTEVGAAQIAQQYQTGKLPPVLKENIIHVSTASSSSSGIVAD